jgi:TRAP-type transport system periplasmic protein
MLGRGSALCAAILVAVATGCAGTSPAVDKAGAGAGTLELTLAVPGSVPLPQVQDFKARLEDLSHGQLRIRVLTDYGEYLPGAEKQIVHDVAAGSVDLGWAGTRAFEALGVHSMAAVSAPMLVSNDEAAQALVDSDAAGQVLTDASDVGVKPLALVWDGTRLPISVKRPFLRPADWDGETFGTLLSPVQERAIRALGSHPWTVMGPYRDRALQLKELDGFEMDLRTLAVTKLAGRAPEIAYNVGLWPQMEVLSMSPDRYATLSRQQRSWVSRAAEDTAHHSVELAAPTAADLELSCKLGGHFVAASPDDLRALRAALEPVYVDLNADPDSRRALEAITHAVGEHAGQEPTVTLPATCRRG